MADLGMAAKSRPCVVVSIRNADELRNMSVVVPLTASGRRGECEIAFPKPRWLYQDSVANLLGIAGIDNAYLERKIGRMPGETMDKISDGLVRLLGLENPPDQPSA